MNESSTSYHHIKNIPNRLLWLDYISILVFWRVCRKLNFYLILLCIKLLFICIHCIRYVLSKFPILKRCAKFEMFSCFNHKNIMHNRILTHILAIHMCTHQNVSKMLYFLLCQFLQNTDLDNVLYSMAITINAQDFLWGGKLYCTAFSHVFKWEMFSIQGQNICTNITF